METALVAGGAGFIGSHLCDQLVESGYRVVVVDNLLTGKKENIAHLIPREEFVFIEADIVAEKTYQDELVGKYDFIFHLASPASPNQQSSMSYMAHPIETMLVNSMGTYRLLELAKREKAKFLFASTSEVYGDPQEHPQKETYWGHVNPNGIRSCYDESKRFGEAMTMTYVRNFKVDARMVRIFNTYGPRMDPQDGRAMVNFIVQGLQYEPFTVYGDGTQTRSFCYVSDLVEGILRSMFTEATQGEVINLGNSDEYTMTQLVEEICLKVGRKKNIEHSPLPSDDPQRRKPDIAKAKVLLDWEPKITLREGLEKTIEYFRTNLSR